MRRILLVLVAVSVLLWSTTSMAGWRFMRQRWDGDPDEFESTSVRDDGAMRRIALESVRGVPQETAIRKQSARISEPRKGRHISIDFSGRRFFLEK